MVYFSIMAFFVCAYLFGFTITSFVRNSGNFLERNLMRVGFGIAIIPSLGLLLNIIRVPLDFWIFFALSLIYPIYFLIRKRPKFSPALRITKDDLSIMLMLLIFLANLYVYASGAFSYPYLEDDDSWSHAMGVKFVSVEKTAFEGTPNVLHYVDPYPPAYDMLLGIIHQTNSSMYFTLKFFNALIISLSTIFFYFFVKKLTGNRNKALLASLILFSLPAFLSHFIWALSLTVPLYFVGFYALEMIKEDRKWCIVAGLAMVTVLTSSPTHSAYFVFLSILYFAYKFISDRRFPKYEACAIAIGAVLCFAFWFGPMLSKHGAIGTLEGMGFGVKLITEEGATIGQVFGGTGDRVYNFNDFYAAQENNMVNNPIGIGKTATILTLISIILAYFHIYRSSAKTKQDSMTRHRISVFFIAASFILFLAGSVYWISTSGINPLNNPAQLEMVLRHALPYIFFALGILILLYSIFSKILEENTKWVLLALMWFLFSFYAVNAAFYPVKISPFRAWMILAIPVSMLAAEAFVFLASIIRKSLGKYAALLFIVILLFGVYQTSAKQKVAVNMSPNWPAGGFWTSTDEIAGYLWFKDNINQGANVFTYVNNAPIIGYDKFTCHWCPDIRTYQRNSFNQSGEETYSWLKKNNYQYLIIDGQTAKKFGSNETNTKVQGIVQTNKFKPVFANNGFLIFELL